MRELCLRLRSKTGVAERCIPRDTNASSRALTIGVATCTRRGAHRTVFLDATLAVGNSLPCQTHGNRLLTHGVARNSRIGVGRIQYKVEFVIHGSGTGRRKDRQGPVARDTDAVNARLHLLSISIRALIIRQEVGAHVYRRWPGAGGAEKTD